MVRLLRGHSRGTLRYSTGTLTVLKGYSTVLYGYSDGTQGVLYGYSDGTQGVLGGHSRGTRGVLLPVSFGAGLGLVGRAVAAAAACCRWTLDRMKCEGRRLRHEGPCDNRVHVADSKRTRSIARIANRRRRHDDVEGAEYAIACC